MTAVCAKCHNPIELQADGRWGTRVRMIRGCYHRPAKGTEA